ncbi:MAG: MFS transporter [Actinobacteria bacterium]|nr:MFS transporter [Actinomycetota bacterium]
MPDSSPVGSGANVPDATPVGLRVILRDPSVRVAMLIVFVVMLGFGIIVPILPLYARSFGVGYEAAGLLISAFAFMRLVFDLVAGPLVDRYGERRTAAVGVIVVGVSSLLLGLAPNFTLAVVFRGAGGAGSAVFFAAVFAYLLRVVPKDRVGRTLSIFFGSFNIGVIAGGPIGGLLAGAFGLQSPLFVYAGLCGLAGVLYLRFMKDPERAAAAGSDGDDPSAGETVIGRARTQIRSLLRTPAFVTVIVLNFANLWLIAAVFDTLVPLFAGEGLGMSPVGIGAVFAVAIAAEFVVLYPAGSAADRHGRRPVILPALAALTVMVGVLGFAGSPLVFVILMGVLGVASGFEGVLPAVMLSDVVPDRRTGTPVGVYRFCGDLGFVLGPLVAGASISLFGFRSAFAIASLPLVLAFVLVARTPETLRRDPLAAAPL